MASVRLPRGGVEPARRPLNPPLAYRYDRITPLLTQLHWLKVPERVAFKLAVLVYRCLHQTAPPYLAEEFHQLSADEGRQRLRSASSSSLVVRCTRLSTIGDRAFPVAAARLWNTTAECRRRHSSISVFRKCLKIHFFGHSFPVSPVVCVTCHFGHYYRSFLLFYLLTHNAVAVAMMTSCR